jgi:tRNA pseudouridine38-40 synthase
MKNIALSLSYNGTAYHGFQIQKNAQTIQGVVTAAIYKATGEHVSLSGCGRTDAGVHARRYLANFKSSCGIPADRLPLALNARLPMDVSVKGAALVPDDFDARFDCVKKEYTYYIHQSRIRDPFLVNRTYSCSYRLNLPAMQTAASYFAGTKDFASHRSVGTPVRSTVRTVHYVTVSGEAPDVIAIRACANGFLYNMVRAIAGTLFYVGIGKLQPGDIPRILASCDREQAGPTLPPEGLFLTRLWYNEPAIRQFQLDDEL